MSKASDKAAKQLEALEYLNGWKDEILEPSSLLEFRQENGKADTDYVSVHLYYQKDGIGHVAELSYNVGLACGYTFRRGEWSSQLALGGGGYSKKYDVALRMFQKMEIDRSEVNWVY